MKSATILLITLVATLSSKNVARGNTFVPRRFAVTTANRSPLSTTSNNKDTLGLPKNTATTTKMVVTDNPRGGAGPIEPLAFAKWTTVLNLINSSITYLIPEKVLEAYGLSEHSTPMMELMYKRFGAGVLSEALIAFCLHWHGTSVETAVGVSLLPTVIEYLRSELAGEPETLEFPKYVQFLPISIAAATSYACFQNVAWCATMQKVNTVWLALNALQWTIWPESFGKLWRCDMNEAETEILSWTGITVASMAVYYGCLAWGVTPLKALGFSWMPHTVGIGIKTIAFPEQSKKFGLKTAKVWLWMALGVVASVTLAFGDSE